MTVPIPAAEYSGASRTPFATVGGPSVSVTVNRLGGLAGALTYALTNLGGTAVQGTHYTLPVTNLVFVDSQSTTNLTLGIVNDSTNNADRVATLALIAIVSRVTGVRRMLGAS